MAVDELRFRVMASDAQVIIVDGPRQAGRSAHRALDQLEACWSRFVESSDISRLNRDAGRLVEVDSATLTLVEVMIEAWRITGGRFDPTVLPALLDAGYTTSVDDPRIAAVMPAALIDRPARGAAATPPASLGDVLVDREHRTVTVPAGIAIDGGGIGKGLAADLVVAELLARGARGVLVSIGGDLSASGTAPNGDGWLIDLEDPADQRVTRARIAISGGGVATSSTLGRRWTHAGVAQHHVIDPDANAPSSTDLVAVTVVGSNGWRAEAHATALLLAGSIDFAELAISSGVDAIATTADGETLATEALVDTNPGLARPEPVTAAP